MLSAFKMANNVKCLITKRIVYNNYKKYIKKLMDSCTEIKPLTTEQKRRIKDYYKKHYGKNIPDYLWHQYYYSLNGIFSEKYIPNYILSEINSKLFDSAISKAYDDKNLYYVLFPNIKQPKAYLNCINGFYYKNGIPLSKANAIREISNIGNAIIKPTYCSCNGDGVKYLNIENGQDTRSKLDIASLIDKYEKNFVIQEVIHQHPKIAALNPSSVNTIRIVTYRRNEDIEVIYAVMRIGKFGSEVDNTSSGGMVCKIDELGKLSKIAISSKPAGHFIKNDNGIYFENYQIPFFDKVVEQAKRMHFSMPHFIMIGWDFCVDDENDVVFVEMNAPMGLHQPAAGPGYGKYTDEIFEMCFGRKNK